jgi:hypothetical protein
MSLSDWAFKEWRDVVTPLSLELSPKNAVNILPGNQNHIITVIVKDQNGKGISEMVTLSTDDGILSTNTVTTNTNGYATFIISCSYETTATITATSTSYPNISDTATKTWTEEYIPPDDDDDEEEEEEEEDDGKQEPVPVDVVEYFTVDFLGEITKEPLSSSGRLAKSLEAPSPDGTHIFRMERSTLTTDQQGNVIKLITIREAEETPELPDNMKLLGVAYDFEPSGISFDRDISITLGYDVIELPQYVTSVNLAYYDINTGWFIFESKGDVVAELGEVTAPVKHFTTFAVLAELPVPAAFELSNLSIITSEKKTWELVPLIVRKGKDATISVDITNIGATPGEYVVFLKLNGEVREDRIIEFEPGEMQHTVFTLDDIEPGTYTVEIGNLKDEFESTLVTNWWLIVGLAAVFGLSIWLIVKKALK